MKKLLITLVSILTIFMMDAKTIHWITFIDTTDPSVGKYDVVGREMLYNRYIGLVNAALDEKGYNHVIHDYYGARTSPENCRKVIESLQTAPDDLIMFYYIGHGARAYNDNTRWPQMALAQNYDEKLIPLSWVHSTLKSKPHRLLVTIGMCCNSEANITPKSAPSFKANYGNTFLPDASVNNILQLFLGNKGDVILSSSKPKESSWPVEFTDGTGIDAFTFFLTNKFNGVMSGEIDPDWNSFFNNVGVAVEEIIGEQHPQWETNLTAANIPGNSAPSTQPTETAKVSNEEVKAQSESRDNESTDERDKFVNFFNLVFNTMLDQQDSDEERIDFCEKFRAEYPSIMSSTVKTLGQDGNVVVGKQSLEDFIGRLATSRVLRSISVADINNRTIYVREIYRQ